MGSPVDPARLDRLRDAEARFRLRRVRASTEVVEAAVGLLLEGIDLPEVAIVAGDDRVDDRELENDLDRALAALGLGAMTFEEAAVRYAGSVAAELLDGRQDPKSAAATLWSLWVDTDYADALSDLGQTAEGFLDVHEFVSESDLRAAAADFLAQAPGG